MNIDCNSSDISSAAYLGHTDILVFLYDKSMFPDVFEKAMFTKNSNGNTPFSLAAYRGHIDVLTFVYNKFPNKFKKFIIIKENGNTPFSFAIMSGKLEALSYLIEKAPDECKAALNLKDEYGNNSFLKAAYRYKILPFLAEKFPDEFEKSKSLVNSECDTIYSILKKYRFDNYRKITKQIEKENSTRKLYKETLNRIALSQAWHLGGFTDLKPKVSQSLFRETLSLELEGHEAPQWCQMIHKDLDLFKSTYSDKTLSDEDINLIQETLLYAANPTSYSPQEKIDRLKQGLPIIIFTGFSGHSISMLIWGNKIVICNRDDPIRKSVEIFEFDPQKFDVEILTKIEKVADDSEEGYNKLIFNEIKQKINLVHVSSELDAACTDHLPHQTVGNCSFVGPITAIFAIMLLKNAFGADEEGHMLAESASTADSVIDHVQKTLPSFQAWLSFQQLQILERNIQLVASGDSNFEPDHFILLDSLFKAYLLPLDEPAQKKLEALTQTYLSALDTQAQSQLKTYIACWSTLNKVPLL